MAQASSKGLHDYFGFNGKILLSTVMPDELIDRLETKDYFKLINDLKPDATMVPDNYTYTDVPLYQSWSQTIRLVSFANEFLKLNIPRSAWLRMLTCFRWIGLSESRLRWAMFLL